METLAEWLTLAPFERHPGRTIAAIGTLFAAAYLSALTIFPHSNGRIVEGDTIQYYAYLRSMAIDHDLDFTNDYRLLYAPSGNAGDNIWLTSKTPAGRPTNLMSIGPALLWAPFFMATYAVLLVLRPLGVVVPLDGIAAPFPLSAGVAGILYAALGAYLCYRSSRLLFPQAAAFWGALVAWLASPAIYYSLVSPAYSHAPSLFASALFAYVWLATRGDVRWRRFLWLGVLAGIAALVRWQEVIILALPGFELIDSMARKRTTVGAAVSQGLVMGAATAVTLLPQILAWRAIYGHFILMPHGEGFMQWGHPAIVAVLFSLQHGLFSWTPAVVLGAAGLVLLARRDALAAVSALAVVILSVYINASVSDWWAGEAFGARRFVAETVFFAWGTTAIMATNVWRDRPTLLRWAAVLLIVYNLLFLLQYEVFMRGFRQLAPYPATLKEVLFDRFVLPWRLLAAWLHR